MAEACVTSVKEGVKAGGGRRTCGGRRACGGSGGSFRLERNKCEMFAENFLKSFY